MPKMQMVFDIHYDEFPEEIRDIICELREVRQDSYSNWNITSDEENQSLLDSITDDDEKESLDKEIKLQKWLRSKGAQVGTEVLILYWW